VLGGLSAVYAALRVEEPPREPALATVPSPPTVPPNPAPATNAGPTPTATAIATAPSPTDAAEPEAQPDPAAEAEAYVAAARARREAERRGQAAAQVAITLYTTTWCGYCKQARAYLGEHRIAHVERDIEADPAARERRRTLNPRGGVPTFEIDSLVLNGWSAAHLEQAIAQATALRAR
jgi:glutaredoxin